jgi:hypothetical protein
LLAERREKDASAPPKVIKRGAPKKAAAPKVAKAPAKKKAAAKRS